MIGVVKLSDIELVDDRGSSATVVWALIAVESSFNGKLRLSTMDCDREKLDSPQSVAKEKQYKERERGKNVLDGKVNISYISI